MDYMSADTQLHHRGHGGKMTSRKLENNTYLERLGLTHGHETIGLLLHRTYIAKFIADGSVILASGGWETMTTKDRLGYVSGFTVFGRRLKGYSHSLWWVGRDGYNTPDDELLPFFDGIHLDQRTGALLSSDDEIEQVMEARRPALTKGQLVKNYLSFILDPDSMATFATEWEVAVDALPLMTDTATWLKERPAYTAQRLLERRHFDMGVVMKAIELDIAVRGEHERSAHWEAMEWAQVMGEGKEPKHFRSIMRRLINFSLADA